MSAPLPVPCLHRIHRDEPSGAFRIHQAIGVSVELGTLVERLAALELRAQCASLAPRSAPVTFDDGWADPLLLTSHFMEWPHLQPVIFLTRGQLQGDRALLPLPRLYEWCAGVGLGPKELAERGVDRRSLKAMPEAEQHALLDSLGVPRVAESSEVLSARQLKELLHQGWILGSHAHDHHDLRFDEPEALVEGLQGALDVTLACGGRRWLAWPEGRCTYETCEIARSVGFELQFSLRVEAGDIECVDLVHRGIWR